MSQKLAACFLSFILLLPVLPAEFQQFGLDQYLSQLRASHPLFRREGLSPQIEQKRRESFKGKTDWLVSAKPSYLHQELPVIGFGVPENSDQARVEASAEKLFWDTGGRASLRYQQSYTDQQYQNIEIPELGPDFSISPGLSQYYDSGVFLSYRQPLLKKIGGLLDRLDYELASFDVKAQSEMK